MKLARAMPIIASSGCQSCGRWVNTCLRASSQISSPRYRQVINAKPIREPFSFMVG